MGKNKELFKKFETSMGFSNCSVVHEEPSKQKFQGRGKGNIVFNCSNYRNEEYNCKIITESDQNRIVKSECEEIVKEE